MKRDLSHEVSRDKELENMFWVILCAILAFVGFSTGSIGAGVVFGVIGVIVFCSTDSPGVKKKNFLNSPMAQTIIKEFRQCSNYIDVWVYQDRVEWYQHVIRYNDRGYKKITSDETHILAEALLEAMPEKPPCGRKKDYSIVAIKEDTSSPDPHASLRYAVGDYTDNSRIYTVGYYLHNKNFDGRYLKILDEETRQYHTWDCKERKWVEEYKDWK